MPKAISISDLEQGRVGRVRLTQFAKLCGLSDAAVRQKVKSGIIEASRDESGHIFIDTASALRYLRGEKYSLDPRGSEKVERINRARKAKARQ